MITNTAIETNLMIFKTSIRNELDLKIASTFLNNTHYIKRWSVDLDDWEKVLKVETNRRIKLSEITDRINVLGFECRELDH